MAAKKRRKRKMPERFSRSLGRPLREQALPWDICSILSVHCIRPAAVVLAGGCACAVGVTTSIRPGDGTSGTAKTRRAGCWCAVGRPPSGSNNGVSSRKFGEHMRRPSENGALDVVPWAIVRPDHLTARNHLRTSSRNTARARGHAANGRLIFFVTGRAAMTRRVRPAAAKLATAVTAVARPSTACAIANVSG